MILLFSMHLNLILYLMMTFKSKPVAKMINFHNTQDNMIVYFLQIYKHIYNNFFFYKHKRS